MAVGASTQARAQTPTFNLAAGLAVANGNFGDRNDAGYALIVGIGMKPLASPLSFRAEGIYTEYNQNFEDGKARAGGITGNAIYDFSIGTGMMFTPYAIGGIGYYSTREPVRNFNVESQTNIGWNIGGGVRFPLTGFSAYVEARYQSVGNVGIQFAPIVFGLSF
jgi:opacity protein-like surface antigen